MGNRAGLLLLLAIMSGSLAAFLAFTFIRSPAAPAAVTTVRETVPVVVAARDINVGATLSAEDVKITEWPGNALPTGFATSPDEVVGLGVRTPVAMNEPLLPQKLAGRELGAGIEVLIPDSMRAVSVPVNSVTAVAGWAKPGARVDVMVTLNDVRTEVEPVTQVVLQNVEVLGNNQSIARDQNGQAVQIDVMTLLVSPQDAERLAMAETNGRLHLALRNPLDHDTIPTTGVRESGLLRRMAAAPAPVRSGGPVAPAPPPPPTRRSIEVIRGTERQEVRPGGGE
jgi:pilus assembly protein CpaB